ncbi:MAG: FeoA domain-containing protein [Gemmatimonadota bacterium]
MVDPVKALLLFIVGVLAAALLLMPRWGLVWRVRRLVRLTRRVRLEDALKHVYSCERDGHACSLESLAGRLGVSRGRAGELLSELARLSLVDVTGEGPVLTEEGRESALRIIRTHRLWERYLADHTGVPATEWHARADEKEHTLSDAETEALSASLGHPRWDPHGDPIPTAEGEVPPRRSVRLSELSAGEVAEIVHLEDEPPEIYRTLLDEGLSPGMTVEVAERTPRSLRLRVQGRVLGLDPVTAGNVSVRRAAASRTQPEHPPMTLAQVSVGQPVRITGIAPTCQGPQRRRLLDLGVIRGTIISPELEAASGDPVAYRIRGALIALRREQAEWIEVEPVSQVEEESSSQGVA